MLIFVPETVTLLLGYFYICVCVCVFPKAKGIFTTQGIVQKAEIRPFISNEAMGMQ